MTVVRIDDIMKSDLKKKIINVGDEMKNIVLEGKEYTLEKNYKDCFNIEDLKFLYTDYFESFDYILGDYSYNKLRLKGYYDSKNKNVKKYNDIKFYSKYLEDFCAAECPYFLIKKSK